MGLESPRYAVAALEWLGMRLDMLNAADWGDFQVRRSWVGQIWEVWLGLLWR